MTLAGKLAQVWKRLTLNGGGSSAIREGSRLFFDRQPAAISEGTFATFLAAVLAIGAALLVERVVAREAKGITARLLAVALAAQIHANAFILLSVMVLGTARRFTSGLGES